MRGVLRKPTFIPLFLSSLVTRPPTGERAGFTRSSTTDLGRELDTGAIKANSKIAESLYRKALGDGAQSVTAAIFWLKTRAQWKETVVNEVNVEGTLKATDSIRLLMERIALVGRRIQDRGSADTGGGFDREQTPDGNEPTGTVIQLPALVAAG